jgi:hypothetical protein
MTTVFRRDGSVAEDPATPVRPEAFTEGDAPKLRAEQLTRLQRNVIEATAAARDRRASSRIFEVEAPSGGATIRLEHRLGRVARWAVVDWARTAPGGTHGLERSAVATDTNDENTLTLRSYVAGQASIEVW